jgi:hypothetical protein
MKYLREQEKPLFPQVPYWAFSQQQQQLDIIRNKAEWTLGLKFKLLEMGSV